MKKFMAVYIGSATPEQRAQMHADEAKLQAGMEAWGQWMHDHEGAMVDPGGPLGKAKRADRSGISDRSNNIAAYVIVHAESHEEAARMFDGHPHFTLFPGEAVEIMECLPMPGA
jgi:hypothetical protein